MTTVSVSIEAISDETGGTTRKMVTLTASKRDAAEAIHDAVAEAVASLTTAPLTISVNQPEPPKPVRSRK